MLETHISILTMTLAKEKEADAPGAAMQGAGKKGRPSDAKSTSQDVEDKKKGVEFEADGGLHLRGGAGRTSTRYTSTTIRKGPRTRASTGSSQSRQSYVSYGSGTKSGSSGSYVSYEKEKKRKKAYTAKPRYQMMCCAFM